MRLPAPVPAATALVGLGGVKRTFRCDGVVKRTYWRAIRPRHLTELQSRL
ncbi:hypothetical protein OGCDGJMD_00603 [Cyanobium usitatum str. Tous]|nr:hypothetical protein OGCDGJMD_00603 [Cyanobium usitatum str. Tous]